MPLYVSYYTENTPYERIIEQLVESFERNELRHKIYPVPDRGSWFLNCLYKPEVIKNALQEEEDVVWVDADNYVLSPPPLFEQGIDCDVAVHSRVIQGGWSCSASVMYWRSTPAAMKLIDLWIEKCKVEEAVNADLKIPIEPYRLSTLKASNQVDQGAFMNALWESIVAGEEIKWFDLPKQYVMKFDSPAFHEAENYIVLNQAARIFSKDEGSARRERNLQADRERWKGAL